MHWLLICIKRWQGKTQHFVTSSWSQFTCPVQHRLIVHWMIKSWRFSWNSLFTFGCWENYGHCVLHPWSECFTVGVTSPYINDLWPLVVHRESWTPDRVLHAVCKILPEKNPQKTVSLKIRALVETPSQTADNGQSINVRVSACVILILFGYDLLGTHTN